MTREFDIITAMDTCADLMVTGDVVPRFGQAEKMVEGYFLEMGGSACIFSCQCAKLGLKTTGVGVVGKDTFGDLVMKRLAEAGVDTSLIETDPHAQTGLGVALCKLDGDRAILTVNGTIDRADPEVIRYNLSRARHLHIASYYLMEKLRPHWLGIVREAKRLGMTVSLDTNWDPAEKWDGIEELMPFLDIFFPNEQELRFFTGEEDVTKAAQMLAIQVPLVVAKLGAGGALAVGRDGRAEWVRAQKVSIADTVGAGDTFDAGFLYGILTGRSLRESLETGTVCAAKSITQPGGFMGQPTLGSIIGE